MIPSHHSRRSPQGGYPLLVLLLPLALVLAGCAGARGGEAANAAGAEPAQAAVVETAGPRVVSTPPPVGQASSEANSGAASQPEAVPTRASGLLGSFSPSYTGEIVAEQVVPVVAQVAGEVVELNAHVGDPVKAGDVLLRVDTAVLEAQVAQAQAALELAGSQLELAKTQPKQSDLDAARAAVKAARSAYERALAGPTDEDKRMALAQLRQAEAAVNLSQSAYDRISGNPYAAMMPESLQLQQATLGLEAARAAYDKMMKGATADMIAGAYAQLTGAEAQLARLERGAEPAQIRAAEAGVKQAELAVYLAQLQLDKASIEAPVDGYAYKVDAVEGGMVGPGTPVVILFSEGVKILIPVEESRSQEIQVGQPVMIRVDAFPGRTFDGIVSEIAPTFDHATRTVQVTVRPAGEGAADLKPGMFATVEFGEPAQ